MLSSAGTMRSSAAPSSSQLEAEHDEMCVATFGQWTGVAGLAK